uniref:Molybdopterin molybdenumtransferase n=1 Tax=Cyanothece sp. (strain PCC 7425 / ATCC 29141) TaxID=395961 RepID=B8HWY9_CYAP4
MISAQAAADLILGLVEPLRAEVDSEDADLLAAGHRVLAREITSSLDFPYWDNSAMDGYAVRYEDIAAASQEHPAVLRLGEEIPAGTMPEQIVQSGQAARIFTGSRMPSGADTVVPQEQTQRRGEEVLIFTTGALGDFVRYQGSYYRAGSALLRAGTLIQAAELAVLATVQCTQIPVFRRPEVVILSTGNELVSPGDPLGPAQIVDSNQYALAHLVTQAGARVVSQQRVGDSAADLRAAIQTALNQADLILSSGGVSVGDYDLVEPILAELGGEIHIRAVAIKPGKPLTVATFPPQGMRRRSLLYFGLPGNPVSALVCFWRFVLPALRQLSGLSSPWHPPIVEAITHQDLQGDPRRETYLWGKLSLVNGRYEFSAAAGSHSSANLINLAGTNGLAVLPLAQTRLQAGQAVQVLQVSSLL